MTPKQHCENLIAKRGGGRFARVSDSEDVCYLPSCNYFNCNPEGAEYSYYYETHDTPPKIELTSETVFTLPANRARTTIGVGEAVIVSANIDVTWQVSSNLVTVGKQDSQKILITALDKTGSVTVTAKTEHDTKSMTFSIIAPSGVSYSQSFYPNSQEPMVYHPKDLAVSVVGLSVTLLPTTVNFDNLTVRELDAASKDSGIFKTGDIHCHSRSAPVNGKCVTHTPHDVNTIGNKHNLVGEYDRVGGGENDTQRLNNLPHSSSMIVNIPIQWKLNESNIWNNLQTVKQSIFLYKNGSMTISKGNFSRNFNKGDSFENDSFL
ncbi:hypothetical protein [Conchiformibius kuhniae]|uniref:Uncharacterized protein n=1 Tax=Conchiformibius kuhniae TaxID=211502 RepID=A0A8T9MUS0_9NEIS|nr:hypothetical protein [Conchiformibius kuhniae]UOP04605.1 hypothetical protein LVJ77_10270 [Conchiformibius kuhniae]